MWQHRSRCVSEKQKGEIRNTLKGKMVGELNPFYGKHHTEETKTIMRLANTGYSPTEETIEKLRVAHLTRLPHSIETRGKIRNANLRLWANKEWAKEKQRQLRLARHIKPNKPETLLLNLLNRWFPGEWKYTGDGQLNVGGKYPDFHNGDHHLIELFGIYWHRNKNPRDKIDFFAEHEYKCLVIWDYELKREDTLKQKITDWYRFELSGTVETEP